MVHDNGLPELPYLCTWDHEPDDAEKLAIEPDDIWLSQRVFVPARPTGWTEVRKIPQVE